MNFIRLALDDREQIDREIWVEHNDKVAHHSVYWVVLFAYEEHHTDDNCKLQ